MPLASHPLSHHPVGRQSLILHIRAVAVAELMSCRATSDQTPQPHTAIVTPAVPPMRDEAPAHQRQAAKLHLALAQRALSHRQVFRASFFDIAAFLLRGKRQRPSFLLRAAAGGENLVHLRLGLGVNGGQFPAKACVRFVS